MSDPIREALIDATAHLAGAASAYRTYAKRATHLGKVAADPFFTTRANDFDGAVERARAALAAPVAQPLTDDTLQDLVRWAYTKLHNREFSSMDDALKLDEMKLLLEHGIGSKP